MDLKTSISWKVYLLYLLFVVGMIAVISKTFMIQAAGRENLLSDESDRIQLIQEAVEARRGQILDDKGEPLVTSVAFYEIRFDATVPKDEVFNEGVDSLALMLSELFGDKTPRVYRAKIQDARSRKDRFLLIKSKATNEQRKKLRNLLIFLLPRHTGCLTDDTEITIHKRRY